MIKNILVATDGSETSEKAVVYAADLAKQLGASISLLGVIDTYSLFAPGISPELGETGIRESTEDVLRRALEAYLAEAAAGCENKKVPVSKLIRKGHPVEEIVKTAESEKTDLIILGSHGRSALKAAVLGSVAYGVLHKNTAIPVLIVRR